MALTNTPKLPAIQRKYGASGTPLDKYIEGASQTYLAMSPVILSSGKVIQSTSPLSSSNKTIGLANVKASGTTNAECLVLDVAPDALYIEMTLSDSTAGTHTLAQTDIGLIYPVTKDSVSNIWYLDANATSTDGVLVQRAKDPIGTVDARVLGKLTRPAILGG